MPYEYDPDDKFGYKDTLPENHPEKVITGVEFDDEFKKISGAVTSLEDALTGDGQFVDAPDDGQLYGRKNKDWEVVDGGSGDWDTIENKPTEFPPSPHTHPWGEITNKPDLVEEAPDDGKQYVRESEAWAEVDIPESGGSSVHIGENPPADPEEGQQWMEVPASGDATMWIYDGGKWLEQPSSGGGGDTDLTGYATETYVDDSIAAIKFPDTDFTNYYTSTEVDNKLSDHYTKSEADAAFAGAAHTHPEYALASKFVICTQAEYDGLSPAADTVYFIK